MSRHWVLEPLILSLAFLMLAGDAEAGDLSRLADLSLEDLLNLEVVSVSKREEQYLDTAAATYVLTSDDITRLGASSIAEALRAVPGIQANRVNSTEWAISARGFNGVWSNKLLVMVDGRTVFSPMMSQVFWDSLELPLDQVDRIEVIRGPGGAMWGANAVNGVINIITKKAEGRETAQTFRLADDDLTLSTGITHSMPFAAGDVRGYLRYSDRTNSALTGESTQRVWDDYRAGFRYDGIPAENHELLIEGDLQHSDFAQWDYLFLTAPPPGTPLTDSYQKSGNVLVRYSVEGADHSTTVQAYYDAVDRHQQVVNYLNRTLDVELRTVRVPGERWVLNLGGGLRRIADSFAELPTIEPDPADRVTYLWNAYSQAEFAARAGRLRLIAGAKIERSSTAGIHVSPTLRLSHRFAGHRVLWAGVSRAVSTPARTYEDIALRMTGLLSGGVPVYLTLRPGEDLVERVTAFEAGYRTPLRHWLSADVVTYLNRYDRLLGTITPPPVLTIEPGGARVDAEATWATGPAAETWGAELALEANRLGPISRLRLGYTYFRLAVGEEAPRYAPANPIGSSPTHQAFSNLTIPLPRSVELDTTLRYTSRLDKVLSTSIDEFAAGEFAVVEPYVTVDAQIRWNPLDRMHLAVGVRNLGGPDGPEFRDLLLGNSPHEVHESFYSLIRWEI